MTKGGNYHGSLEELFTLQKIEESKVIRNKYSLRFRIQNLQRLDKTGTFFFLIFGFTHLCAIVNVALSYESD